MQFSIRIYYVRPGTGHEVGPDWFGETILQVEVSQDGKVIGTYHTFEGAMAVVKELWKAA